MAGRVSRFFLFEFIDNGLNNYMPCRPSRLLQFTGILTLGLGDAAVSRYTNGPV